MDKINKLKDIFRHFGCVAGNTLLPGNVLAIWLQKWPGTHNDMEEAIQQAKSEGFIRGELTLTEKGEEELHGKFILSKGKKEFMDELKKKNWTPGTSPNQGWILSIKSKLSPLSAKNFKEILNDFMDQGYR